MTTSDELFGLEPRQRAFGTTLSAGARRLTTKFASVPLFERIIYYMLIPELFCRVVLEAGLNIYWYSLIQPKLWVFYLLILCEFVVQVFRIGRDRFELNINQCVVLLFAGMTLHGALIGLAWGNSPAKVITDTIPVLVTSINIALLNRKGALDGFSFERLRRFIIIYSILMVGVGTAAVAAGRLSVVTFGGAGGTPICLTILLVSLIRLPKFSLGQFMLVMILVAPTVPNTTRTTVLVFVLIFAFFMLPRILAAGRQAYVIALLLAVTAALFPIVTPADSPLMRRVDSIMERLSSDKEDESGSLYERKAEWEAINKKLHNLGPYAEAFGYGAGGTYTVEFSEGRIPENYSHAHFSWALFKLRYGDIGFIYLGIFVFLLVAAAWRNAGIEGAAGQIGLILDIWCLTFLFTYVFFNFIVGGVQFADTRSSNEDERVSDRSQRLRRHAGTLAAGRD